MRVARIRCAALLAAVLAGVLVVSTGDAGTSVVADRAGRSGHPLRAAPVPTRTAPAHPPGPPCADRPDDAGLAHCAEDLLTAFWSARFATAGRRYTAPRLVVPDRTRFTGPQAAVLAARAFYDRGAIHLPVGYLAAVHARFGRRAPLVLDFVLAHETGHLVQDLLGLFARSNARATRSDLGSRRVETQADCLAGVWAHAQVAAGRLDPDAFRSAAADELRRLSGDTAGDFEVRTHGSPDERIDWLRRGLVGGTVSDCDTFAGTGTRLDFSPSPARNAGPR